MNPKLKTLCLFTLAWLLFGAAAALPTVLERLGPAGMFAGRAWLLHFIVKTAMIAASLGAIAWWGKGFAAAGFQRAVGVRWRRVIGIGLLLGAMATALIVVTPAKGIGALRDLGFLNL